MVSIVSGNYYYAEEMDCGIVGGSKGTRGLFMVR